MRVAVPESRFESSRRQAEHPPTGARPAHSAPGPRPKRRAHLARWRLPCMGKGRAVGGASRGPASRAGPDSPERPVSTLHGAAARALLWAGNPCTPLNWRGVSSCLETIGTPGWGLSGEAGLLRSNGGRSEGRAQPQSSWNSCPPLISSSCRVRPAPALLLLLPRGRRCTDFAVRLLALLPKSAPANMASGVQVADEVCRIFYDMKVRKCSTPEEIKKRKKAVIFCLSADKKCIVVEEGKEILVGDVGATITDPFKHFVGMLPEKDCRYALYDASFETKESRKEELMFFLWAPEQAPLKSKMIYASSKDAIKKKFPGIKHEYQANGPEDLNRTCIAEKLGGSLIVAFEGSPV